MLTIANLFLSGKSVAIACRLLPALVLTLSVPLTASAATWSVPAPADVKTQLDPWLQSRDLSETQQAEIDALWPAEAPAMEGAALLDNVAATLAVAHPDAKALVAFCRGPRTGPQLPEFKILAEEELPDVVRNNLRLLYGSWLARNDMHEEALAQFEGLTAADVVDPASLLFYRSVCHHRLRDKEQCLPAIAQLLENEAQVPRRFREIAQLMKSDLEPLEPDTLDEVARLMDSIRRRLDLGRVGQRVRQEEDDVIAKLDKMIEDLEKQRQQMEAQQAGNPQPGSPASPLEESRAAGGRGEGDVDPRKLDNRGNWGNLPPRDRQEALQQISKELPAHYREAIEEYFRKLARESQP